LSLEGPGLSRNGFDWSRYPVITGAAAQLVCRSAIIDGEVVVQDSRGVSDFLGLEGIVSTLSEWAQQNIAQEQVLH
jgi:bifunctional non-homologous end joining protein LigD